MNTSLPPYLLIKKYLIITGKGFYIYNRISRVKLVRHMHDGRGQSFWKFDLRQRSRDDPSRSKMVIVYIWVDASWRYEDNDTTFTFLSQLAIQSTVIRRKLSATQGLVTFYRVTGQRRNLANQDVVLLELGWSYRYSWKQKHLNISLLTYSGEVTKSTWPQGTDKQNPKCMIYRLWWRNITLQLSADRLRTVTGLKLEDRGYSFGPNALKPWGWDIGQDTCIIYVLDFSF